MPSAKRYPESGSSEDVAVPGAALDRLSSVLERFPVRARLFHAGPLCGVTHYDAQPGRGFLHVLRRGDMVVTHRVGRGVPRRVRVAEPALLLYPAPLSHDFHNAPADGADFVCATVDFAGGAAHPLVRALPPLVLLPLREAPGLDHALALLFAETEHLRCGQRVLVDRLFDVVLLQLLRWLLDHPPAGAPHPAGLLAGLADPQLARALAAVHDAPADAWDLPRLAAVAGLSRTTFAERFRATVGQTPADYLAGWRIGLAQALLREGRPVKAVADRCGYASPSALARTFRARNGQSPREWLAAQLAADGTAG